MDSTIQLRIDSKTKQAVNQVFKTLGLDITSGIKIYFKQVLRSKGIPFPLITENGFTPKQESLLLAESLSTNRQYRTGKRRAARSVEQLLKQLED